MERRIRVLWFVTPIPESHIMGGTPGRIVKWYSSIDKKRFDVHILLSGRSESSLLKLRDEYARRGIPVDVIPGLCLPQVFLPSRGRKFREYISGLKPDIVHTLFIQSDLIAAYFKRRLGVNALVSSLEGALYPKRGLKPLFYGSLYAVLRHRLDAIIALCHFTREQAVREYGVSADACRVIYSGIDASLFPFPKTIKPSQGSLTVGFLGYIGAGKRIDLFVDTIPDLLAARPNLEFVVGGIGNDLDRVVAKVAEMGISAQVDFRGYVSDVATFFSEMDVFVFLSEREGLPWVILESQAAGVPTVASPVGGVPEVITDGRNGILLSGHTAGDLCASVKRLIDDVELRRQFSRNSRRRMEESFTAQREIQQIESLYEHEFLCKSRGGVSA